MEDLFKPEQKKGINKVFIAALLIGLVVIGAGIWVLSFKPSMDDQSAQILQGTLREGSPGFEELSKNILISRDEKNTIESPTGLGTISMFIRGNILNRTGKTIDVLQVNVSVINQKNEKIREKDVIVVPAQQQQPIASGETVPITLTLDGFAPKDDRANINFKVKAIKVEP